MNPILKKDLVEHGKHVAQILFDKETALDGIVGPHALVFTGGNILVVPMLDDKDVFATGVRGLVSGTKADAVLFISEAWIAVGGDMSIAPSKRPDRVDALFVEVETRLEPGVDVYWAMITENGHQRKLGKWTGGAEAEGGRFGSGFFSH